MYQLCRLLKVGDQSGIASNFFTHVFFFPQKLSEGLNAEKIPSSKSTDHTKVQYRDESSQVCK